MRRFLFLILSIANTIILTAQRTNDSEDVMSLASEILAEMASDGVISEESSADVAEIADILNNPINLNTVTEDELNKLLILTDEQIKGILSYRRINQKFESVNELMFVNGFDLSDAYILHRLFCANYIDTSKKRFKNECLSRVHFFLPKSKGYIAQNDTTSPKYLGKPFKLLVRNKAEYRHWQAGFTAEKDAGEPMFSNGISLTDFTSAYVQYKNDKSYIRQVIIGHYFAQYGEGLGLWTGFAPNTSSIETSVSRRFTHLKPSLSANESDYLRGAAVSLNHKDLNLDLFFSQTDNDASLFFSKDSISEENIQSIQTNGYHRTQNEIDKRHNMSQMTFGGYTNYSSTSFLAGIGVNHWHSSYKLAKRDELYMLFRPQTDDITTVHANYKGLFSYLSIYGEVAWQSTGTLATTHGIDFTFDNSIKMSVAFRKFGNKYYCIRQNPNSRASQPGGETGVYAAISGYLFNNTEVLANIDVYRNNWLAFQKPFPHNGYRSLIKVAHQIDTYNTLILRLRFEESDRASYSNKKKMATHRKTHLRIQWESSPHEYLKLRTTVEKSRYKEINGPVYNGFWIGQEIRFTLDKPKCGAALLIAHFDIDNYDCRIYPYIPDMPYSMTFSSYNDKGFAFTTRLQWAPYSWLKLWALANHTHYSDKKEIGTGDNLIDASHKTEIKLQVKVTLSHFFRHKRQMQTNVIPNTQP